MGEFNAEMDEKRDEILTRELEARSLLKANLEAKVRVASLLSEAWWRLHSRCDKVV